MKTSVKISPAKVGFTVECVNRCASGRVPQKRVRELTFLLARHFNKNKILKRACGRRQKKKNAFYSADASAQLTIVFLGTREARRLNKTYRKKDYATDVLSFADNDAGQGLGELVFCLPVLKRQAREHGLSLQRELDYLLIHGFLHLLGYDHEKSPREELKMMNLQDRLFEKFKAKT